MFWFVLNMSSTVLVMTVVDPSYSTTDVTWYWSKKMQPVDCVALSWLGLKVVQWWFMLMLQTQWVLAKRICYLDLTFPYSMWGCTPGSRGDRAKGRGHPSARWSQSLTNNNGSYNLQKFCSLHRLWSCGASRCWYCQGLWGHQNVSLCTEVQ